jgi:deoxyribonuclease-4
VLFGAHCGGGIKGSIDRAVDIGADALQLFVQSPRAWRFPDHDPADLDAFRTRRSDVGLGAVFVHALYLVNLAADNEDIYAKSAETLRRTVETASAIQADGVVFHVGSHLGAGLDETLDQVAVAIAAALERCSGDTMLLIENTAGAGGTIGRSVEELATIVDRLERHQSLGLCLDSCHLYGSGYDVTDVAALDALIEEIDRRVGLDRLRCLHINDSKAPLGSNRDRHDDVLAGLMGERLGVFLSHPALEKLPAVLETPGAGGRGAGAADVAALRELYGRWAGSSRPRSAPGRGPGKPARPRAARRTRD